MGGAPGIVQEDGQEADARKAAQGGQLRLPGATAQDLKDMDAGHGKEHGVKDVGLEEEILPPQAIFQKFRVEGQIVGELTDEGEDPQPQGIPPPVPGVPAPLGNQERVEGEGDPPDDPQQGHLGKKDCANVVNEHGGQGDELEMKARHGLLQRGCLRHSIPPIK